MPTLQTSLVPMQHMDVLSIVERLLKLSIPNTYVWLWGFYLYFHLWLNFLAELTRFGDRQFYKDWWNARTIDRYWFVLRILYHSLYSLKALCCPPGEPGTCLCTTGSRATSVGLPSPPPPFRHFLTRLHPLDYPLIRKGVGKNTAVLLSFAFSAIFHELIISLPFGHVSFHAFFGMLAQAPLIALTKLIDRRFDNAFVGNAIFWCLFCVVGQPMGIIMYYYDIWKFSAQ